MRAQLLTIVFIFSLISCGNNDGKITLGESTGRINHLTIVIDNDLWKGKVGDSLREIIAEPVLGLPQEESQFSVTQVPTKAFGKLFRTNRNLLIVSLDDKTGYGLTNDAFASPQIIMNIKGKTQEDLIRQIQARKKEIIQEFRESDLGLYQKKIVKDSWDPAEIKTFSKLGLTIKVPKTYGLVDDTGDFLWFRQNINEDGSMNIIAYELPLISEDSIVNNIVSVRDMIGEKYIPGPFDGTYMITEAAYTPFTSPTELNGMPSFETRGKWEIKNDFMAGPFLNYTIIDKPNNRIIIFEGFTYAPSVKKRDFMFELEAIIKTLKV